MLPRRHAVGRRGERGDRGDARCRELFDRGRGCRVLKPGRHETARRLLAVGRITALLAIDDIVVAHLGRRIGRLHRVVAADGRLVVDIERVRVLHHKFPRPHQAVSGSDFIPEFRRDLVEVLRQVAIAGDLGFHQWRDDLLMGRPEHEFRFARRAPSVACVVGPVHDFTGSGPAWPHLPEFHRMQMRHPELNGARVVHLLATELCDLPQRPQSERQIGIEPAAQLANEPRAQQELVRGNLGVGRAFFQCRNEKLRPEFHEAPVREQPPEWEAN